MFCAGQHRFVINSNNKDQNRRHSPSKVACEVSPVSGLGRMQEMAEVRLLHLALKSLNGCVVPLSFWARIAREGK